MKKRKRIMAIVLAMALPISLLAQSGLFIRGDGQKIDANKPLMNRNSEMETNLSNQGFGNPNGSDLTNQTFGAPLGSGLLIMLLAGAGYSAMKTNRKNNENKE